MVNRFGPLELHPRVWEKTIGNIIGCFFSSGTGFRRLLLPAQGPTQTSSGLSGNNGNVEMCATNGYEGERLVDWALAIQYVTKTKPDACVCKLGILILAWCTFIQRKRIKQKTTNKLQTYTK